MMYKIFNYTLESNILIPELPLAGKDVPDFVFQLSSDKNVIKKSNLSWFHHWKTIDGNITISCAKIDKYYLLSFPKVADFLISNDKKEIICNNFLNTDESLIRHLLIDQVIPRVVGHAGNIVLHASAILFNNECHVFLGQSGWGKSTLAASFYQNNTAVISDDCIMLAFENDSIHAIANYPGFRLWDDSYQAVLSGDTAFKAMNEYSDKKRLIMPQRNQQASEKFPVTAIFLLSPPYENYKSDNIKIEPVLGKDRIIEILKHAFYLDVTDRDVIKKHFQLLGNIASSNINVCHLLYPRIHNSLNIVREAIFKTVLTESPL